MTQVHHVGKPQRWDKPFGNERMAPGDLDRVLSSPLFRDVDTSDFPRDLSLSDIVANDGRIVRFSRGEVIVRKGDYGNSAFLILKGSVRGIAQPKAGKPAAQRRRPAKMSWLRALSQLWRNSGIPETRKFGIGRGAAAQIERDRPLWSDPALSVSVRRLDDGDDSAHSFVSQIKNVEQVVETLPTFQMGRNELFGELAALARSPRSTTIFADADDTELLELRWQGFRDIRNWLSSFHDYIDTLYRERGLATRLRESPLFNGVNEEALKIIAENAQFETHGNFEWTHHFQRKLSGERGSDYVIEHEPVIAEQGHYLEGLILIHSGFARVSEKFDHAEKTVGYLAKDDVFGLEEIIATQHGEAARKVRHSLRAIGYVDVIRIPTQMIEQYVLPTLRSGSLPRGPSRAPDGGEPEDTGGLQQSMLDFLVDNRFINGTKTMAINTDRCVNCDDCVRACASTHDGNPRFVRHGHSHLNLMVANACMHCVDPVCLIGCPTGAIHRDIDTGNVVIDDPLCVGCATCANSCPYNNIRMVEIRDASGKFLTDPEQGQIMKATKCDLCAGQLGGPACQRACPHDALMRIDIRDTDSLNNWLKPV